MTRLTFAELQHATIVGSLQARQPEATPEPVDPTPTQPIDSAQADHERMMQIIHKNAHKETQNE